MAHAAVLGRPIDRLRAWTRRLVAAHIVAPEPEYSAPTPSIEPRKIDPKRIGRGFVDERQAGKARIVVTVEPETLAEVRELAVARGVPVAVVIREFVERGLSKGGRQ